MREKIATLWNARQETLREQLAPVRLDNPRTWLVFVIAIGVGVVQAGCVEALSRLMH